MNRVAAIEVKQQALEAIKSLSTALNAAKAGYDVDEMTRLHREIGTLIGHIQMGLLEPIYESFPDLDDLA